MSETIKSILNRRSYRKFKRQQIKPEELQAILDCGIHAPSAMNSQGWHFTAIQNAELIERMSDEIVKHISDDVKAKYVERNDGDPSFSMFYFAPTVIVISGADSDKWATANIAYAVENMCIAAESLGIGSCIIGMASLIFQPGNKDQYCNELKIPEKYTPYYAVAFGYKDMVMPVPARAENTYTLIK